MKELLERITSEELTEWEAMFAEIWPEQKQGTAPPPRQDPQATFGGPRGI